MNLRSFHVALVAVTAVALGDPAHGEGPKAAPVEVTAEALAKECKADSAKATAKYKGKALRVTGKAQAVFDELVYLDGGGGDRVIIRCPKGTTPAVKAGETATFAGTFDLVAVLGPSLSDCKLVSPPKK